MTDTTEVEPKHEGLLERVEDHLPARDRHAAPGLLPGELKKHPTPIQYVSIAVVLVVITAIEIATSYLEGSIPNGLITVLLLAMAAVKFFLVAFWFMHLRTDQPVFKRLFVVGAIAAPVLYLVVLATLHGVLAD